MDKDTESIRRFTQNFIKKYSREELRQLLKRLSQGDSGQAIAEDFNVTRDCVGQWMHTFGTISHKYTPFPELSKLLNIRKGRREVVRQNFVRIYGQERFEQLLKRLSQGDSGQAIADDFNVSRERIRQWMHTFGVVTRTYEIFPVVLEELNKRGRGGRDPTFVV